jgi:putative transposase
MPESNQCGHPLPLLCKYLKEFHYTREGKINGYRRMFYALKQYCKEKNIDIPRDFSEKEMRKIMNDHGLKGKKRSNYPCKKPKVHSIEWIPEMDKVNNNFDAEYSNKVICMDIKYIKTDEGWLYINAVRDFHTKGLLGWQFSTTMDYFSLVKPSVEQALKYFTNEQIKDLILHTDNGKQYYHQDLKKLANEYGIILSKKRPNCLGGNALSENWFAHLAQEWLPYEGYKTIQEGIEDVTRYIHFFNNKRICSKFNTPPMHQFKVQ